MGTVADLRPEGTRGPMFEPLAAFLERARLEAPFEWLVPLLVPARGNLLVVAPPNAGKTFLALVIAKEAAAAGRSVAIVEEEGSARGLADRLDGLVVPTGASISIAHQRGFRIADPSTFEDLLGFVDRTTRPVVILDPLTSIMDGDENKTAEAKVFVGLLRQLRQKNPELLLVVLHHTSKAGSSGDGPALYASRGSTEFSGWTDAQLNLKGRKTSPGSGQVAFDVEVSKMRDAERGSDKRVTITLGAGDVEISENVRPRAKEDGEDPRLQLATRIADALAKGPRSGRKLANELRAREQDVHEACRDLEEAGSIQRAGFNWRLPPKQSDLLDDGAS